MYNTFAALLIFSSWSPRAKSTFKPVENTHITLIMRLACKIKNCAEAEGCWMSHLSTKRQQPKYNHANKGLKRW